MQKIIFRGLVTTTISFFLFLSINATRAAQDKDKYVFAADDWCPVHCSAEEIGGGYIVDIIKEIFDLENIQIEIVFVPWQRAVRGTNSGRYDGLLTPTKKSNPEMFFHSRPIGFQEYCIYSTKDSDWKYSDFSSFKNSRVAYLKDSGLGALDTYFDKNENEIEIFRYSGSDDYIVNLFKF